MMRILVLLIAMLLSQAAYACLPPSIQAALDRANASCGIQVTSTLRRGAIIAGTNRPSHHATCRAADFTSKNYPCVYRVLKDWPGKLSLDSRRMGHVHIDDSRYARFNHGSKRHVKAHSLQQHREVVFDRHTHNQY